MHVFMDVWMKLCKAQWKRKSEPIHNLQKNIFFLYVLLKIHCILVKGVFGRNIPPISSISCILVESSKTLIFQM